MAQALDLLGERCGIVGTLGTGFYGALESGRHTTPDPLAVQATLATLKQAGARAAMEVLPHGSTRPRRRSVSISRYQSVPRPPRLSRFDGSLCRRQGQAVRLAGPALPGDQPDDDFGRRLAGEEQDSELITYSLTDSSAPLLPRSALRRRRHRGGTGHSARRGLLRSPLLGRFNLSNLLAAVGALLGLLSRRYPPHLAATAGRSAACSAWEAATSRWWWWTTRILPTPWKVLEALRPHAAARLLCLFGCGGDRDAGKRPLMAAIAERLADGVLVTDDNPRTEASGRSSPISAKASLPLTRLPSCRRAVRRSPI